MQILKSKSVSRKLLKRLAGSVNFWDAKIWLDPSDILCWWPKNKRMKIQFHKLCVWQAVSIRPTLLTIRQKKALFKVYPKTIFIPRWESKRNTWSVSFLSNFVNLIHFLKSLTQLSWPALSRHSQTGIESALSTANDSRHPRGNKSIFKALFKKGIY